MTHCCHGPEKMRLPRNRFFWFAAIIRFFAISKNSRWSENAEATQEKIFRRLLASGRHTAFGREHGFESVRNHADFCELVPTAPYEELFPYIARMLSGEEHVLTTHPVTEYAKSSGTTNSRSKFIPTSRAYMRHNHLKAARDIITAYARRHPDTQIFLGKAITVTGSYSAIPDSRFLAGDISALMTNAVPWWAQHARSYRKSLALHPSWPYKAKKISERTLDKDIVSLWGAPTWMLEILELAKEKSGKMTVRETWPDLEVFFHGAISFAPYRKTYEDLIGDPNMEFCEIYNASEGVFAFEDDPKGHPGELLLCTDHDIFYEFIPVADCMPVGEAVRLDAVVAGRQYALVITTGGGLWRYIIGDVVVFTSTNPYRLKIVGRTTQFMNAFGEEVVAENAARAIEEAALATGSEVQAFTAAPTFFAGASQGAHEWAIEFRVEPNERASFARALDISLRKRNSDYDAKRAGDVVLGEPILQIVPGGTFRTYMEREGKLGGQNKMPMLSNERKYLEAVLKLASIY